MCLGIQKASAEGACISINTLSQDVAGGYLIKFYGGGRTAEAFRNLFVTNPNPHKLDRFDNIAFYGFVFVKLHNRKFEFWIG